MLQNVVLATYYCVSLVLKRYCISSVESLESLDSLDFTSTTHSTYATPSSPMLLLQPHQLLRSRSVTAERHRWLSDSDDSDSDESDDTKNLLLLESCNRADLGLTEDAQELCKEYVRNDCLEDQQRNECVDQAAAFEAAAGMSIVVLIHSSLMKAIWEAADGWNGGCQSGSPGQGWNPNDDPTGYCNWYAQDGDVVNVTCDADDENVIGLKLYNCFPGVDTAPPELWLLSGLRKLRFYFLNPLSAIWQTNKSFLGRFCRTS